jgi:hypothetical protein
VGRWTVVLPLLLYLAHVLLYIRHVNDDAFITFRYSRFLAMGRGPVFNVGEAVEGYTNFLLMLLLTPVYAIGGEGAVPVAATAIGVVSGALIVWLTFVLTRRVMARGDATGGGDRHPIPGFPGMGGVLAASLVAVAPGFAVNCTSGLETGLYGFLIMLAIILGLDADRLGRWRGAGIAWAAAAWTRPEGVAIFGVWWLARAVALLVTRSMSGPASGDEDASPAGAGWWRWLWDGVAFGGGLAVQLGFRLIAYGQLVPNTYHAKMGGYLNITPWEYLSAGALAPLLGVVGVGIGLVGCALSGTRWRIILPVAAVGIAGAMLPFVTGTDWMPGWRFSVPYLAPLAVVVVIGWWRVLGRFRLRSARVAALVAGGLLVAAIALHLGERRELIDRINLRAEGYARGHRALAEWIRSGGASAGSTVALMDIGIVGYLCPDHHILDVSGLTDAHIARSPGPFLAKRYDMRYVLDQEPELVVLALTGPGDATAPLPPEARLRTWTETEHRLLTHPDFAPRYRHRRRVTDPGASWLDRLAGAIGAERVFEHLHPDQYYLLAVFRRQR